MTASHRFEEHVGEVAMIVRAPSLAGIFEEAGRALAELLLGAVPDAPADGPRITAQVHAPDAAALLVEWLNELIFLTDTRHAVFTVFTVRALADGALTADLQGVSEPQLRGEVKAATLHQARLEERDGGFEAHVVLDV